MKQQDLVWVNMPFSNLAGSKIRPSIIVSNNNYNKASQDVVVCAVTSNLEEREFSITIDNDNLSQGSLPIKSKVRADKVMQVEKKLILNSFAKLNDKTYDELAEKIKNLIARK